MSFIITVDSGCTVPSDFVIKNDIRIIPFSYSFDGNIYSDTISHLPSDADKSSSIAFHAPEIQDYVDFWRRILSEGIPILHISTGSNFSSAFRNALTARDILLSQNSSIELSIVDSCTISGGCELLLHRAVIERQNGKDLAMCVCNLEDEKHRISSFIISDNPRSMYRSGIIGLSSLFRTSITGEYTVIQMGSSSNNAIYARDIPKALSLLVNQFGSEIFSQVCISYCGTSSAASALSSELYCKLGIKAEITPMSISQSLILGSDSLSVFFRCRHAVKLNSLSNKGILSPKFISKPAYL